MLKYYFSILALLTGVFHSTRAGSEIKPGNKADEIRAQIEVNFKLKSRLSTAELNQIVAAAIREAQSSSHPDSEREIKLRAHEVVRVAQCYGIDPVIFASLIYRESNFRSHAQSERGASGLTQMTRVGITEVLERLSPSSHRRFGGLRRMVRQCNPNFLRRVPYEVNSEVLAAWKNSVSYSDTDALVMGALLFKINLASSRPETRVWGKAGMYQEALERYNGDPKIKVQFARDVLMLAKRMMILPEVAVNDSKYLSRIQGF